MANNEYVNKVDFGDNTLIDLTSDTVTEDTLVTGYTAHTRSGATITGTLSDATTSTHGLMSASDKSKLDGITSGAAVTDVLINSTSILNSGVANISIANTNTFGVVKPSGMGVGVNGEGLLYILSATSSSIKNGATQYLPITPSVQHESVFYGLAKAAGDSTQAASSNTVGTYTDNAKTAILTMLSVAPTASPIFTGSISMGRYTNYAVGENSVALGDEVMALDHGSVALNVGNVAGSEGSLAINFHNNAMGVATFVGGISNYNLGMASYVLGQNSVNDPYIAQYDVTGDNTAPDWTASTSYNVGDIVWYMPTGSGWKLYKCLEANSDSTFDKDKWSDYIYGKFIERIGNGTTPWLNQDNNWGAASNARTLDWDGNERLKGDIYIHCNADSSGGVKLEPIEVIRL